MDLAVSQDSCTVFEPVSVIGPVSGMPSKTIEIILKECHEGSWRKSPDSNGINESESNGVGCVRLCDLARITLVLRA